jgi:hypothetical protein
MRSIAGRRVVDEHAQRQREEIVRALTVKEGLLARMELPHAWG